jgi:nicotinamide-nucleotide amidase
MEELDFTHIDEALVRRAAAVMAAADRHRLSLVTAESCTGGLLAAVLSEAPGASEHLEGGFTVYTEAQKTIALGVPAALIDRHGAVSEPVARALAEGALASSRADVAAAITGVAGPARDADGKPVGLVHFAAARRGFATLHEEARFGDIGRGAVRYNSVLQALGLLQRMICLEARATAASDVRRRA